MVTEAHLMGRADRRRPRILALSAYATGSHRLWLEKLTGALSAFDWTCRELPARHFNWRIRGNPLSWWRETALSSDYDCILATSMVDLATLLGLNPALARTRSLLYFHENQFAYPLSATGTRWLEPLMVQLYGAMAASVLVFNTEWNRSSFFEGVQSLLSRFPDAVPAGLVARLAEKSRILAVPVDPSPDVPTTGTRHWGEPHIIWNHRWEYDKGPDRLRAFVGRLLDRRQPFRLSVVGQGFRKAAGDFEEIKRMAAPHLVQWGFLPREQYQALLADADLVLSTAIHDFQGLSVMEAMAAGCLPWVPDALAYPEYVPAEYRYERFPDGQDEGRVAADALIARLPRWQLRPPASLDLQDYGSAALIPEYRRLLTEPAPISPWRGPESGPSAGPQGPV